MKWKKTLSDVGLTEETISHGLRKKIKDYYGIQSAINQIQNAIKNPELDEDQREELEGDLETMQQGLEQSDDQLVKAILVFDKNKEKYAEMSKHLGKGRPKKNASTENTDSSAQKVENQSNSNPAPAPTPAPTPNGANEPSVEPKKKNGLGFVLLAVAIGVISLGAVSMFKNKD
jgi:hypothetical protein